MNYKYLTSFRSVTFYTKYIFDVIETTTLIPTKVQLLLSDLTSPSSVKTIFVLTLNFFFKIFLASWVLVVFFFIFDFDVVCIKEKKFSYEVLLVIECILQISLKVIRYIKI